LCGNVTLLLMLISLFYFCLKEKKKKAKEWGIKIDLGPEMETKKGPKTALRPSPNPACPSTDSNDVVSASPFEAVDLIQRNGPDQAVQLTSTTPFQAKWSETSEPLDPTVHTRTRDPTPHLNQTTPFNYQTTPSHFPPSDPSRWDHLI